MMWSKNRDPENIIFIDKEADLQYPPTIVADNTHLPIRLKLKIDSIIFDPPWGINLPPWFLNKKHFKNPKKWGINATYYGDYKSKQEMISYLHKAQKEFQQYTNRLCFKWGERNIPLWNILTLFTKDGWHEVHRIKHKRIFHKSSKDGGQSKNKTWWVVLERIAGGIIVNKVDRMENVQTGGPPGG